MILISNNLRNYITVKEKTAIRINLAWYDNARLIENLNLNFNANNAVFLDVPTKRTKPPLNRYNPDFIRDLCQEFPNIKYLGISNVNGVEDLIPYLGICQIVPKIESIDGINNSSEIVASLGEDSMVMLDHEDLHNDLIKHGINPHDLYEIYVKKLEDVCNVKNCKLLKTVGIVFSDL